MHFQTLKQPESSTRLGTDTVLSLNLNLSLCQLFENISRMCPQRKVHFRMLSKSSKSGKIKHLKLMGDKIRIQMDVISNTTNAKSDQWSIEYFYTTLIALEPILLSSLTYGSEGNDIELPVTLSSVKNFKTNVNVMYRLRSEMRSLDCVNHFFFYLCYYLC